MPSSHLILCRPLLLLPRIPPNIRVFYNESTLRIKWPKYWSFSFSIIPSKEHPGLISFILFYFFISFFIYFLLYNIVLVLPYINVHPPRVYMCSPSWTPLPPPSHIIPLGHPSAPAPSFLYPPSNLDWWFISYMILYMFFLEWSGWISLQSKGLSRVFSIVQKHQLFGAQLSSQSNSHVHTWPLEKP